MFYHGGIVFKTTRDDAVMMMGVRCMNVVLDVTTR